MSFRIESILAGLILLVAIPAQAETTGMATLGYAHISSPDSNSDINGATLDLTGTLALSGGLTFGADLGLARLSSDGDHLTLSNVALRGSYGFAGGLSLGGYLEAAHIGLGGGDSSNIRSYGIEGGFARGAYSLAAYVGASKFNDIFDEDTTDYGIRFAWQPDQRAAVWALAQRTEPNDSASGSGVTQLGLAGAFAFNAQWTGFGGLTRASTDGSKLTAGSLGVAYDLSQSTPIPAILGLELSRLQSDDGGDNISANTLRISLSFPLGGRRPVVPLDSLAEGVRNPRHSALTGLALASF